MTIRQVYFVCAFYTHSDSLLSLSSRIYIHEKAKLYSFCRQSCTDIMHIEKLINIWNVILLSSLYQTSHIIRYENIIQKYKEREEIRGNIKLQIVYNDRGRQFSVIAPSQRQTLQRASLFRPAYVHETNGYFSLDSSTFFRVYNCEALSLFPRSIRISLLCRVYRREYSDKTNTYLFFAKSLRSARYITVSNITGCSVADVMETRALA